MEPLGINFGFFVVQLLAILIWIGLPVMTLLHLRKQSLNGVPLVLWVLLICAIPLLGALAYWIVRPSAEK